MQPQPWSDNTVSAQRPHTCISCSPRDGPTRVQAPPALEEVVLEEYDTRNGREQRVRVGGLDGLVFKRKVGGVPR